MSRTPEDFIQSHIRVYESEIRFHEKQYHAVTDAEKKAKHAHALGIAWEKKRSLQIAYEDIMGKRNQESSN